MLLHSTVGGWFSQRSRGDRWHTHPDAGSFCRGAHVREQAGLSFYQHPGLPFIWCFFLNNSIWNVTIIDIIKNPFVKQCKKHIIIKLGYGTKFYKTYFTAFCLWFTDLLWRPWSNYRRYGEVAWIYSRQHYHIDRCVFSYRINISLVCFLKWHTFIMLMYRQFIAC